MEGAGIRAYVLVGRWVFFVRSPRRAVDARSFQCPVCVYSIAMQAYHPLEPSFARQALHVYANSNLYVPLTIPPPSPPPTQTLKT